MTEAIIRTRAALKSVAPQLVVKDVTKTAEYYRDILGFSILGFFGEPEPFYSIVQRDGVEIHFGHSDRGGVSNTEIRPESIDLYIWVTNLDTIFEELTAAGAEIIEGPVKRVYGSVEVLVRDCNGYLLVFAV